MKLVFDFESRSACDLAKCGAAKYAEHPSTDVICCAVKVDNEEPKLWFPAWSWAIIAEDMVGFESAPSFGILTDEELFRLFQEAEEIEAHNSFFETSVAKFCCEKKYGWPALPQEKMRCSLAKCSYHALPRSLDQACQALDLTVQKDMEGAKLMLKMCKPKKPTKAETEALREQGYVVDDKKNIFNAETGEPYYLWHETPEQIIRLAQYCAQDTEAEYALSAALPDLPPSELAVWQHDQLVNMRGVKADVPAAKRFVEEIGKLEQKLLAETKQITSGSVSSPKQVAAALRWLTEQGVVLPDLTKNSVAAALKDESIPAAARRFLEIRKQLGRASTAKYQAIINAANEDGRIRGTLLYHGASTGRWSGKLVQPQNFFRGLFKDVSPCIEVTVDDGFDFVETLWGDLMGAAATCIRGMLVASPGHRFVSADFSSIEARVNAWVAGEETVLRAFREKKDLYKVAASQMFNKPVEEVTKQERQIGKTVELACIAEGQLVLTNKGLVPIEKITLSHLIWDGQEFVSHDGVIYRGERTVISYGGLTATEDHIVWAEVCGEQRQVHFGFAASSGSHLVQSGSGRRTLRVGGDHISGAKVHARLVGGVRLGSVRKLRPNKLGVLIKSRPRKEQRLSVLLATEKNTRMAEQAYNRHAAALREPERRGLEELRRPGDTIQLSINPGSRPLDNGESRPAQGVGDRPGEQQWALRAGKPTLCNAQGKRSEPAPVYYVRRPNGICYLLQPVHGAKNRTPIWGGIGRGQNNRKSKASCSGEKKKLEEHSGEVRRLGRHRVYDIVNCGPRNRFTVSNVLVHNCGYQGGIGAYAAMAKNYGINLESLPEFIIPVAPEEMLDRANGTAQTYLKKNPGVMTLEAAVACDIIKQLWREKRPNIVALWHGLEEALLLAVKNPGSVYRYRGIRYKSDGQFLRCKLPSGRYLHYFRPGLQIKETPWGQAKEVVTFYGVDSVTRKFVKSHIYGGGATENAVQAISRDVMAESMLRCENSGYPTVLSVHDELLSDALSDFGSVEEFESIMSEVPTWAEGLPVAAEGWAGRRYRK